MKNIIAFIGIAFILSACAFVSWAIVCGFIKLVSMCFGLGFSFKVATGIWLILVFIKIVFGTTDK